MTTFQKIIAAISPFGYPHAPDRYTGPHKSHWFTYNYEDDRGEGFGDDECDLSVGYVQLHLFMPLQENFLTIKQQIRKNLVAQGFTYPDITVETEPDTLIRHIIFSCAIEEEI